MSSFGPKKGRQIANFVRQRMMAILKKHPNLRELTQAAARRTDTFDTGEEQTRFFVRRGQGARAGNRHTGVRGAVLARPIEATPCCSSYWRVAQRSPSLDRDLTTMRAILHAEAGQRRYPRRFWHEPASKWTWPVASSRGFARSGELPIALPRALMSRQLWTA
ncbi:MAG: hypothetical protein LC791_10870 [Acidobacteria bacterium]|nr:hypothetical protein [Acidobacteriota bacterium]